MRTDTPVIRPHPLEEPILADIRAATGLVFVQLGAIDTQKEDIAALILPVLAEWIPRMPKPDREQDVRGAVLDRFVTPYAKPFVPILLALLPDEADIIGSSILVQALVRSVTNDNAPEVWRVVQKYPEKPFYYTLLARLSQLQSTSGPARAALADALESGRIPKYELKDVARVQDPRIRHWFGQHADDPDPTIRRISRRATATGGHLAALTIESEPPVRDARTFSLEIDDDEFSDALKTIAVEFGLKIPKAIKTPEFLESMQLDQGSSISVSRAGGGAVKLWFRLEDHDVVEIVVQFDPRHGGAARLGRQADGGEPSE